jgi:hypothetical protein
MATEKQIQANRANAAKSTGPRTPEGKRISSQNGAIYARTPIALIPRGESLRRFNDLVVALRLEFEPRDPAEDTLVRAMAIARWRLTRMWGITTATLQKEMDRLSKESVSAGSGAVLAANAFNSLAGNSRLLAQHRLEARCDRQYHYALEMLLKRREIARSHAAAGTSRADLKRQPNCEAAFSPNPEKDLIDNAEITSAVGK